MDITNLTYVWILDTEMGNGGCNRPLNNLQTPLVRLQAVYCRRHALLRTYFAFMSCCAKTQFQSYVCCRHTQCFGRITWTRSWYRLCTYLEIALWFKVLTHRLKFWTIRDEVAFYPFICKTLSLIRLFTPFWSSWFLIVFTYVVNNIQ